MPEQQFEEFKKITQEMMLIAKSKIKRGDGVRTLWKRYCRSCSFLEEVEYIAMEDGEKDSVIKLIDVNDILFV